jgi:hypothetical protein
MSVLQGQPFGWRAPCRERPVPRPGHVSSDVRAQVIDELDRCAIATMVKYTATDISASWGSGLSKLISSPVLDFKVRHQHAPPHGALLGPSRMPKFGSKAGMCAALWMQHLLQSAALAVVKHSTCQCTSDRLKRKAVTWQVWDANKPGGKELGGPFDLILASNAIHTCNSIAGVPAALCTRSRSCLRCADFPPAAALPGVRHHLLNSRDCSPVPVDRRALASAGVHACGAAPTCPGRLPLACWARKIGESPTKSKE